MSASDLDTEALLNDGNDETQLGNETGAEGTQEPSDGTEGAKTVESSGDSVEATPTPPAPVTKPQESQQTKEPEVDPYALDDIPEDFDPANWKEVLQLAEDRAVKRIKSDQAKQAKDQESEELARQDQLKAISEGYNQEISSLETSGRLPKGEDGLKRQEEVWTFINNENARLSKNGSPHFIGSFEHGLRLLEAEELKTKLAEVDAKEDALRKARAGMVGGTSGAKVPAGSTNIPKRGQSVYDVVDEELG